MSNWRSDSACADSAAAWLQRQRWWIYGGSCICIASGSWQPLPVAINETHMRMKTIDRPTVVTGRWHYFWTADRSSRIFEGSEQLAVLSCKWKRTLHILSGWSLSACFWGHLVANLSQTITCLILILTKLLSVSVSVMWLSVKIKMYGKPDTSRQSPSPSPFISFKTK